jgi:glutamate synthase domain-containing protein 3
MSGGIAFVWDIDGLFDRRVNFGGGSILLEPVEDPEDISLLRDLVERHHRYTGSARAKEVLERWNEVLPQFVKVISVEYKTVLAEMAREQSAEQMVMD